MYRYEDIKNDIFTLSGAENLVKISQKIDRLFGEKSIISMGDILYRQLGDSWLNMACVDMLVEMNKISETNKAPGKIAQHRTFRKIW